ncbi:UNVERIFIED_CONTAM: hypothetical protein Sradi_5289200 [Sesamum radiatum]|uniref:Uncharacterized protein n=1 Tax=Sesamum radiatum TaxID=300843 RepID=A0AAW2LPG7_SESRA
MWLRSERCEDVIRASWNAVDATNEAVWEKVKSCRVGLLQWERTDFGHVNKGIKETENQIAQQQQAILDTIAARDVRELQKQLEGYRSKEDVMWQQHRKTHWLCEQDRNTKFFHSIATTRKKHNAIMKLMDNSGRW